MDNGRRELEGLGESIAEMCAHVDAAMHRLLMAVREFDARGGWALQGALSCAHWLAWRVGWDPRTAREHVRVARRLGELPAVAEAVRTGALSYSKVRAITRVATPATEQALVACAKHMPAGELDKVCQGYAGVQRQRASRPEDIARRRTVTRRGLEDGMVRIDAILTADEAAVVWAALDDARRDRDGIDRGGPAGPQDVTQRAPCRADNLVALAQAHLRGDRPDRAPIEVIVTVPQDRLTSEAAADELQSLARLRDGTPISAACARRLACDAGVIEVEVDAAGAPLAVGRRTRTIPAAIKRALLLRDRSCRFPGCSNDRFVDGHHIQHWADGGETALGNLVTLCSAHHRLLHEGTITVALDAGQQPTFRDARGVVIHALPPRGGTGGDPWPTVERANTALAISARTNRCGWDGRPIARGELVAGLARWDGLDEAPVASGITGDDDEPRFEIYEPTPLAEIMAQLERESIACFGQ